MKADKRVFLPAVKTVEKTVDEKGESRVVK